MSSQVNNSLQPQVKLTLLVIAQKTAEGKEMHSIKSNHEHACSG